MNCNDILPLICGYLDGGNTESENKNLQAHFASCASCREKLAQMQENDRLLAEVPMAPTDLTWRIMQQVRKEPRKRRNWKQWGAALSAAAVLAVVLLSGAITPRSTEKAEDSVSEIKNEALYRMTPEGNETLAGMTEECIAEQVVVATVDVAAYLFMAPVAELEALEPMDLNEARTWLTPIAAARLDGMTDRALQAYLISGEMMQELQAMYPAELLTEYAEAENCLVFISVADTNTP